MHALTLANRRKLPAAELRGILLATIGGMAVALAAVLILGQLAPEVLKAASGDSIIKPQNGDVISEGLKTINGNALWIMVTGIGTAVTVVGVAIAFGVRDASNWAFRLAGGILIVFVLGPAVVS